MPRQFSAMGSEFCPWFLCDGGLPPGGAGVASMLTGLGNAVTDKRDRRLDGWEDDGGVVADRTEPPAGIGACFRQLTRCHHVEQVTLGDVCEALAVAPEDVLEELRACTDRCKQCRRNEYNPAGCLRKTYDG